MQLLSPPAWLLIALFSKCCRKQKKYFKTRKNGFKEEEVYRTVENESVDEYRLRDEDDDDDEFGRMTTNNKH